MASSNNNNYIIIIIIIILRLVKNTSVELRPATGWAIGVEPSRKNSIKKKENKYQFYCRRRRRSKNFGLESCCARPLHILRYTYTVPLLVLFGTQLRIISVQNFLFFFSPRITPSGQMRFSSRTIKLRAVTPGPSNYSSSSSYLYMCLYII